MVIQTVKIKKGVINLPPEIKKAWKDAEVFIEATKVTISIKKITKPRMSLSRMMDEFLLASKKSRVKKEEVEKVVKDARKRVYR